MNITISGGFNPADPSGSCCMTCCKDSCCACAVSGCIDVDILVWSDVGPSGDLVTSSCASGGGLSFTMCPRIDLCGCVLPMGVNYGGGGGVSTPVPGVDGWGYTPVNVRDFPDPCYTRDPLADYSAGQSAPYPEGMCGSTDLDIWTCDRGLGILGCRYYAGTAVKGHIAGTGNYSSGSILDDYPQMWGFSGKVCGTCTSCGPPAYDSSSCNGACIWSTFCCGTGGNMNLEHMTFNWGGYDCYDYDPVCVSGNAGGFSGSPCDIKRPGAKSPCSPCATRVENPCVPYGCRGNMFRGWFGGDQYSVCGYVDCCNPYAWAPDGPTFDGCPCPWPIYPGGAASGCTPAGWPQPDPCQIGEFGPTAYSPRIERTLGSWPDTCFSFVSGQCSIPSIGQKFIAVYEATMKDYDCDCQTHLCCDEEFVVEYACGPDDFGFGCWQSGSAGGTGSFVVDCGAYQCGSMLMPNMYGAYVQDIYVKVILTEA